MTGSVSLDPVPPESLEKTLSSVPNKTGINILQSAGNQLRWKGKQAGTTHVLGGQA